MSLGAAKSPLNVGKWLRGRAETNEDILKLMNREPQEKIGGFDEPKPVKSRRGSKAVKINYPNNKEFTIEELANSNEVAMMTAWKSVQRDLDSNIIETSGVISGETKPSQLYKKTGVNAPKRGEDLNTLKSSYPSGQKFTARQMSEMTGLAIPTVGKRIKEDLRKGIIKIEGKLKLEETKESHQYYTKNSSRWLCSQLRFSRLCSEFCSNSRQSPCYSKS